MQIRDFKELLAARGDGFWELLATAVGNEHFVSELPMGEVDQRKLHDLLSDGTRDCLALERMHLFRNREELLTSGAVEFLCEAVWAAATAGKRCLASGGLCVAAECALKVSTRLGPKLMHHIADALSQQSKPQDVAELSYLLIDADWTMP
jgi:hypothetical protein